MRALVLALVLALAFARSAAADAPVPAAPTIKLLDAGKGARKPLRFTAKKGLRRTLTTTMTMRMAMQMGANAAPPQHIPPIQVVVAIHVADVTPDGDIRYDFVFAQPKVLADRAAPAMIVSAMEEATKGMAGIEGHAVVTSRGFTKEADVVVPATASQQTRQLVASLKQSMAQLAAPVPEEPVGLGAKWETTTTIDQNGMALVQTATNRLVQRKGDKVTLKITITQTAKPQKITANGFTAELEAYAGGGSGETTLDLAALVPTTAKVILHSDMLMAAMGQKLGMKLDLEMVMKGK